jgi:hypothetical protein
MSLLNACKILLNRSLNECQILLNSCKLPLKQCKLSLQQCKIALNDCEILLNECKTPLNEVRMRLLRILSLLFFLTKKITKKSRQTRWLRPFCLASAPFAPHRLKHIDYCGCDVECWRLCYVLCEDHEGAVFRLVISYYSQSLGVRRNKAPGISLITMFTPSSCRRLGKKLLMPCLSTQLAQNPMLYADHRRINFSSLSFCFPKINPSTVRIMSLEAKSKTWIIIIKNVFYIRIATISVWDNKQSNSC